MRAVAQSADAATLLKQRTLALWVAQNRLAAGAARNRRGPRPASAMEMPRRRARDFVWRETVSGTPNPAFRKIEIVVAGAAEPDYVLARLSGFLGQTAARMIATRRGGFTLIELLIALAILALGRDTRLSRARRR